MSLPVFRPGLGSPVPAATAPPISPRRTGREVKGRAGVAEVGPMRGRVRPRQRMASYWPFMSSVLHLLDAAGWHLLPPFPLEFPSAFSRDPESLPPFPCGPPPKEPHSSLFVPFSSFFLLCVFFVLCCFVLFFLYCSDLFFCSSFFNNPFPHLFFFRYS